MSRDGLGVACLAPGLWTWTLEDGAVSCGYAEPEAGSGAPLLLVDPVFPREGTPEAARFWKALDADLARLGAPVVVACTLAERAAAADELRARHPRLAVTTCRVGQDELPAGCEAVSLGGAVALRVTRHGALFVPDAAAAGRASALAPRHVVRARSR